MDEISWQFAVQMAAIAGTSGAIAVKALDIAKTALDKRKDKLNGNGNGGDKFSALVLEIKANQAGIKGNQNGISDIKEDMAELKKDMKSLLGESGIYVRMAKMEEWQKGHDKYHNGKK